MNERPAVAAVVLAAGRATRFAAPDGGTKLTAVLDGKPLVRHAVEAALGSRARPVVVVLGHAAAAVQAALDGLDVCVVSNSDFATGLASSLKTGLGALDDDVAGVVVLLGDMPRIRASHIDRLIEAFAAHPDVAAVVPVHDGQRGNPVLLAAPLFPALASLTGDQGARKILAMAGDAVREIPSHDAAFAADIDTPEALAQLAGAER